MSDFQCITVIGAGPRGRAFASRCLRAGYRVVLQDVLSSRLRQAEEALGGAEGQLSLASSVDEAVREADLAIDFVPDELESKLEVFSMLDRMAPPRTVLCTPTTLSISDLQACTYRPGLCFALHPFDEGAEQLTLLRGRASDAATASRLQRWLVHLGYSTQIETEQVDLPF